MKRLKILVPKGKLFKNVYSLLEEAGFTLKLNSESSFLRDISDEVDFKLLKAQNIPKLIEIGAHDLGFSGFDWILETEACVEQLLDLKFDPVKIVAAVSATDSGWKKKDCLLVASEYVNLARSYLQKLNKKFLLIRSYGATEVFPPEDADLIVDNMATGKTLLENNLKVLEVILNSSTRLIASPSALQDEAKKKQIAELLTIFQAILNGRERVILEMNVGAQALEKIVKILPAMRSPTIASLYNGQGFSVKVAVPRSSVKKLIPQLKELGAGDILELDIRKVIV